MNIGQMYQLMSLYNAGQTWGSTGAGSAAGSYGYTGIGGLNGSTGLFQQALQNAAGVYGAAGSVQYAGGIATPMDDIFEEAARVTGVDVRLLKAIGKAESDFDASATSHCGAMGVMQLMPGTASALGVSNPYDARENIMGGARYIADLLDKYDGDTRLALAAYNAGSGNVAKYGGIPPFTETQNYVRRVMEYAGQDFTTGRTVSSTANTPAVGSQLLNTGFLSMTSGADYGDMFQLMAQMMRLEMEQKLNSILRFDDI